ncbi:unnamed protein product [Sympodiomycopsis kandeliae]
MPGTLLRRSSRSSQSQVPVPAAAPAPAERKRKISTSAISSAVADGIAQEIRTEEQQQDVEEKPKRRGRKTNAEKAAEQQRQQAAANSADVTATNGDESVSTPKRGRKRAAAATAPPKQEQESPLSSQGEEADDSKTKPAKKPRQTNKAVASKTSSDGREVKVEDEPELDSDGEPVRRAKNGRRLPKKKAKGHKTYVIPDVETRDFRNEYRPGSTDSWSSQAARANGFTGRLGYACLNTVLRTQDPPIFSSRTARIKSIQEKGLDWVKELARANAKDIIPMLRWNVENNIRFMRLSSEIFPFASHDTYGYSPDCASEELAEAGKVARELNHRITMHPGQFVQLGSPNPAVVKSSIRELDVHATVLDLMGMDQDSVMIIHGGGVYGNREATLERMKETIRTKLPEHIKRRLVLENDEISWSAEELLPVCHEFNIPMVFDFHHDMLRPSQKSPNELMPELLQLFSQRGIKPKFHLSHPRPGSKNLRQRRAHSDRCGSLPLDLPPDADLMIEAKDKEQAVLELYRIYNLYQVKHEILRPPADDITTATSGRRKTLNGSGGVSQQSKDDSEQDDEQQQDDSSSPKSKSKPKPKGRETETDKIRRTIEHSKKIAAKRGIEYTGPEFKDPALPGGGFDLAEGEIMLSTAQTIVVMEKEAEVIRNQLKNNTQGRAVSEIREMVEGSVKTDTDQDPVNAQITNGAQPTQEPIGVQTSADTVPVQEQQCDPTERTIPGQEEKVPYAPVTPVKSQAFINTVVVPTSAQDVDKII